MPRLTNAQYLYQRQRLRTSWQHRQAEPFTTLTADEQLRLYVYFAPREEFTDKEAIAHRKLATATYLSLPQQAGRAYVRVLPYLDPERSGPVLRERQTKKARGEVVVHASRRDQIDTQKLARALVNMAKEDSKTELIESLTQKKNGSQ